MFRWTPRITTSVLHVTRLWPTLLSGKAKGGVKSKPPLIVPERRGVGLLWTRDQDPGVQVDTGRGPIGEASRMSPERGRVDEVILNER